MTDREAEIAAAEARVAASTAAVHQAEAQRQREAEALRRHGKTAAALTAPTVTAR
ncbi:hypothetical protein [Streptomyces jumonjinensis]|uniref:hypothetical protein n=1 Tax=Streptomyces jumonjinensis TaxID=1945 RepID=UPI0037A8341A